MKMELEDWCQINAITTLPPEGLVSLPLKFKTTPFRIVFFHNIEWMIYFQKSLLWKFSNYVKALQ